MERQTNQELALLVNETDRGSPGEAEETRPPGIVLRNLPATRTNTYWSDLASATIRAGDSG